MIGAYFLFLVPPISGTVEAPSEVSEINLFSHNNRRIPAGCDEKRGAHYGTAKRLEDLRAPPCPNDANVRTVAKQSTDMLGAGCWYR